jgi:hypothetical protein
MQSSVVYSEILKGNFGGRVVTRETGVLGENLSEHPFFRNKTHMD